MIKVIIPRGRWLRGNAQQSMLFDPDLDQGCCLGHALAAACKIPLEKLALYTTPAKVQHIFNVPPELLKSVPWREANEPKDSSTKAYLLMKINDDGDLTEHEREVGIVNGGKEVGFDFEFID